jgi:glycine cleavage system regulatory protein
METADDLDRRMAKCVQSAGYCLLHDCEGEWVANAVAIIEEASMEMGRLSNQASALTTCEAWLQKQVAERDTELAELRTTAAALMEIAASDADATTRRRMLDRMAMESFAEDG